MRISSNDGSLGSGDEDAEEYLVLLDESDSATSLAALQDAGAVMQVASPRLVLLSPGGAGATGIESCPGVVAAYREPLPAEVLDRLDDSEAMFAAAWALRRAGTASKERRGEGMSWDAPGFQPPDPPARTTS